MVLKIFLRLAAGCPIPLLSADGGKNKDQICHGLSFKPPNLPATLSSFALSGQRGITSNLTRAIYNEKSLAYRPKVLYCNG
jgi:hypothetical protein